MCEIGDDVITQSEGLEVVGLSLICVLCDDYILPLQKGQVEG